MKIRPADIEDCLWAGGLEVEIRSADGEDFL